MMKTWSNLVLIILMICAEASDFSGASAQSVSPHENRSGISSSSDTIPDENLLDIISILTTTSDDSLNMAEADADTHSILDNIISQGKSHKRNLVSSARVLDFMTEAYSQHDFYQSGNWDDAEDFSYITNNVVLPHTIHVISIVRRRDASRQPTATVRSSDAFIRGLTLR